MYLNRRRVLHAGWGGVHAGIALPLLDEPGSNGASMSAPDSAGAAFPDVFATHSEPQQPHLEYLFQIRLTFTRVHNITDMPTGAGRGAVYLDDGVIEGPMLNGRALGNTGGDYALFRPDGVLSFDARYMLETDDGALILMHNRGYLWGRRPDVMPRIRAWIFNNGPEVAFEDYYLRACPTFECSAGRYDWLMRHVIVGVGERKADGNLVRYYALT